MPEPSLPLSSPLAPFCAVPPAAAAARPWRWLPLLALSLLLHALLIGWGGGSLQWPTPHAPATPVLDATLLPSTPPPNVAVDVAPAPVPDKPQPRPRPVRQHTPPPATPAELAAPTAVPTASTPLLLGGTDADNPYQVPDGPLLPIPVQTIGIGQPPPTSTPPVAPVETATGSSGRLDLPPSAELEYDVEALREGRPVYGHGSIAWQTDGSHYRIDGAAGILFFTLLSFQSEGTLDGHGVAPLLYHEKRFRKAATNTHFQRERQLISFSASTLTYPRQGGEQDRASVLWQLAGLGRGDNSRFVAGADIDLFVAGVRDAEPWRMHIVGLETIDVDGRPTQAWHLLRAPRAGSYQQRIDFWLAPALDWYPVKLRYTETNGEYLDLLLSGIKRPAAEADVAAASGAAVPERSPAVNTPAPAENAATTTDWIN